MGIACSSQKKKQPEQKKPQIKEEEKKIVIKAKSQPQSHQNLELLDSIEEQKTRQLLLANKRFSQMLELLGNLDHIQANTREKINQLIILRSNINIIIQNNIKKILKQKQIVKRIEDEDQYLLYNDIKFGQQLQQYMQKIQQLILDQLSKDEEFESAFPIISVSMNELGENIAKIISEYTESKTKATIPKDIQPVKKQSDESYQLNQHRSTKKLTLQQ